MGFLVAPGIPALIMYLAQVLTIGHREAMQGAYVLAIIGYCSAIVLGIPIYFVLLYKKIYSLLAYLVLGALTGVAYYGLLFIPTFFSNLQFGLDLALSTLKNTLGLGLIGIIGGSIASSVFWWIAVKNNKVT